MQHWVARLAASALVVAGCGGSRSASTTPSPTAVATTTSIVGRRTCTDVPASAPAVRASGGPFTGLGPQPVLTIQLPPTVVLPSSHPAAVPDLPDVQPARIPGGILLSSRIAWAIDPDDVGNPPVVLTAVNDDGSVRWQRCLPDGDVTIRVAEASTKPTHALLAIGVQATSWLVLDLADGTTSPLATNDLLGTAIAEGDMWQANEAADHDHLLLVGRSSSASSSGPSSLVSVDLRTMAFTPIPPRPELTGVTDRVVDVMGPGGDVVEYVEPDDMSAPQLVGRWHDGTWTALATDGAPPWVSSAGYSEFEPTGYAASGPWGNAWYRMDIPTFHDDGSPDLVRAHGVLSEIVDDVVVVRGCAEQDADSGDCTDGSLLGLDLSTGETRWEVPGDRLLGPGGGGLVLVTDGGVDAPWTLLDAHTGQAASAQRWPVASGFQLWARSEIGGATIDGDTLFAQHDGVVDVWLPEASTPAETIRVALP